MDRCFCVNTRPNANLAVDTPAKKRESRQLGISYATALLLTVVVELPVVWLLLRQESWKKVLPAALVGNLITHPAMHFLLPLVLSSVSLGLFLLVGELAVFSLEVVVYLAWVRPKPWPRAVAASAASNAASFGLGLVIFPWPG